jgi:hypothetical protein
MVPPLTSLTATPCFGTVLQWIFFTPVVHLLLLLLLLSSSFLVTGFLSSLVLLLLSQW